MRTLNRYRIKQTTRGNGTDSSQPFSIGRFGGRNSFRDEAAGRAANLAVPLQDAHYNQR